MIIIQLCGGLGNQLFQYYFGQFLSKKINSVEIYYDESWFNFPRKPHEILQLKRLGIRYQKFIPTRLEKILLNRYIRKFIEISNISLLNYSVIGEKKFKINNIDLNINSYLKGFWQDYSYLLDLNIDINNFNEERKFDIFDGKENNICVHIRRGDYLTNKSYGKLTHNVLDVSYYIDALKLVNEKIVNPRYIVFSDDIDWARTIKIWGHRPAVFIDPLIIDEIQSFSLMLQCNGYIIANSTYSWWAAFMNKSKAKIIVSPRDYSLSGIFIFENNYRI